MSLKDSQREFQQKASDEEIFEEAKINPNSLDKITEKKIVDAIVKFGETLSGKKSFPYQEVFIKRIIWSLILDEGETIVGEFARQGGKSTSFEILTPSAAILLPLLAQYMSQMEINSPILKFKDGLWVGVYGPDYDRSEIIGSKINSVFNNKRSQRLLSSSSIGMQFSDKQSNYLQSLPRGSKIKVKSANKRVSIEGDTYHLLITDETQEIDSYVIRKSMSPFLAFTNGTAVHIGSAYPEKCYFYDIKEMLKKEDVGKSVIKKRYFTSDYRIIQKYSPEYKKYIKKEKKKLGEHSLEFRMSYELYWPIERGTFLTEERLNTLAKPYGVVTYDKTKIHGIGIDVGKTMDSTVVTVGEYDTDNPVVIDSKEKIVRYNKKIKNWLELSGDDHDSQFYIICDFLDNYNWNVLAVDATGVGAALADRLKNKYVNKLVIPFVFGLDSKSNGYNLLYREILAGRWSYPNSDGAKRLMKHRRFVEQSLNLIKKAKNGRIMVEHADDRLHDDYPDSWMLCNYAIEASDEFSPIVEEEVMNIYSAEQNTFLHSY